MWINLFKRAALAIGAKDGTLKKKRRVSAFIREASYARRIAMSSHGVMRA